MTIPILGTTGELRSFGDRVRASGLRVGLVPTMGALHDGHLALVREAKRRADEVIVTVFVNPTQFGPNEDFAAYPRDLARDVALAESAGATAVFAPPVREMYPEGEKTRVFVAGLTEGLCGASRPGHFEGVATIVTKLFALVGPAVAVFGKKDYQQFRVIQQMASDLFLPTEVVGHPTVRESDGLALSSRNAYLSTEDRRRALSIPRALSAASGAFRAGERSPEVLLEMVRGALDRAGLKLDYVELREAESLGSLVGGVLPDVALLALAAFAGKTRLIDNLVLGVDAPPEVTR